MIEKNISVWTARTCWGFFFRNIKATWTPCRAASWHEEAWDCLLLALPLSDPHSSMIKVLDWIHLDWTGSSRFTLQPCSVLVALSSLSRHL